MRSRIKKISVLFLLTTGLLLLQASIQLLHHHFDDSFHDNQDGFHSLSTTVSCPATDAHPESHNDSPEIITTSAGITAPLLIICTVNHSNPLLQLVTSDSVSGKGSRASPV
ncbi:MAG: hypothetical protein HXX17_05890 [Geobacteraceae bacterium]|nr:hypothetical protein [Geobacteraceae bacterium]